MERRTRRLLNAALVVVGAGVVAGAAVVGTVVGHPEQIDSYWLQAEVAADGSAQVREVIDYDFGNKTGKHGVFRDVPGLVPGSVEVSSPDAPADVELLDEGSTGTRIRIGSPVQTVSGEHRYTIDYALQPGELVRGDVLDWETMGHEWGVPIEHTEIHLLAPFELRDVVCAQGSLYSDDPCEAREVEPGHVVVTVDDLDAHEGVSVEARVGDELASAPTPTEAPGPPSDDSGLPGWLLALATAGAALLGGAYKTWAIRRKGRERVGSTQAADAAFAAGQPTESEVRMDHEDLAKLATVEFAPPSDLTPAQGGVVHREAVRPNHKVAWLIDAANKGAVEMVDDDGDAKPDRLVRTGPGDAATTPILDEAFGDRTEILLGSYDLKFAGAWGTVGEQLESWRAGSGLWEPRGATDNAAMGCVGSFLAMLGAGMAFAAGWLLSMWTGWFALAIVGGLLAGYALAMALNGFELAVRTPAGSAAFLRVESFRRFLAESETFHAEEAARRGVLREYTAWAVALDEIDHWSRILASSSIPPTDPGIHYAYMAPALMLSTHRTSVAPSQSSGGFFSGGGGGSFGGGSVGGGGGGGGGGSW
jgi:predicted membrane protein DUF2207